MLENLKPIQTNTSTYCQDYKKSDIDTFINAINLETNSVQGKTIYLDAKTISQSKLRDAGFTIVRNKDKADVIVIKDIRNDIRSEYQDKCTFEYGTNPEQQFQTLIDEESKGYKYILDKEIYKYVYKYVGDQELFKSCNELLKAPGTDNTKIAMEFMSNANWQGNDIYVRELFNLHYYNNMRGNSYKNSISFKGFLTSLDFDYENNYSLGKASDYRKLCKNEEHHNWVYSKYEEEFKEHLDVLVKTYKIKLDKIEYSIDKSIIED